MKARLMTADSRPPPNRSERRTGALNGPKSPRDPAAAGSFPPMRRREGLGVSLTPSTEKGSNGSNVDVLVAGGGGFIGGPLVGDLLAQGLSVRSVDIKPMSE